MSFQRLPKLPVGLQSFRRLRQKNAIYVDKTEQLCCMIDQAPMFSLLNRPRRFGKSLMLSTLKELYLGNKELFAGTWAYDNYDFVPRPVLYIDFVKVDTDSANFEQELVGYLRKLASEHAIELTPTQSPANIFAQLIENLGRDNPVVVLIDEYDRPLIDHINSDRFETISRTVKNFYSQLKSSTDYIEQCVMTGITEFGKLSIFSGANQFVNISFDSEYMTLFGYTRAELEHYFGPHISNAQRLSGLDANAWWERLKYWYNGYSWNIDDADDDENRVYCPYTVLSYFRDPTDFVNYWAQSGTTNLLVEIMKSGKVDTLDLENKQVSIDQIMSLNPQNINVAGLLFQTGYLTLTGEVPLNPRARLVGYPNREIIASLNALLLTYASKDNNADTAIELVQAIRAEGWTEFFRIINQIMAGISYEIFHKHEHYAHVVLHTILSASALDVTSQRQTNTGRIDIVINYATADNVAKQAIIELKTSASDGKTDQDLAKDRELATQAIEQIHSKDYAKSFDNPVPVGVVVNSTVKQITAWIVEQ